MSSILNTCCGIVKKTNKRCRNKSKHGNYCTIHYRMYLKQNEEIRCYHTNNCNINYVITIQSIVRTFLVKNNIKNRGICVYTRHLCNNQTELLQYVDINDIDINDFYSFKDNNFYWGFHILSLKIIFDKNMNNPYTTQPIQNSIKTNFTNFLKGIEKTKSIKLDKINFNNKYISIQQECVRIFQLMDSLKNYTKCRWFLELNLNELKELYKQLEDIWNYRLNISDTDKFKYTEDGKLFTLSVKKFYSIKNIHTAQNILLSEFNRLVTEGKLESDRSTACQWILSGLTLVHEDARSSMPWLYQSASIL